MNTIQELKDRLLTDPGYVFQYIYGNNPDQVILNLRALGFRISNVDDVMDAVDQLYQRGEADLLISAFTVPMLTDQIDPAEVVIAQEVAVALNASTGGSAGAAKKIDFNSVLGALAAGATAYLGIKGAASAAPTPTPPAPPKKDNTTTIALIAGGAVVLIIIIILVIKRK